MTSMCQRLALFATRSREWGVRRPRPRGCGAPLRRNARRHSRCCAALPAPVRTACRAAIFHRTHRRALRPAALLGRGLRRVQRDVQPRRRQALGDRCRPADRARDQTSRLLRVVVFVRTEPAFEDVAVLALEVENFECHGVYMRITRQNIRKRAQTAAISHAGRTEERLPAPLGRRARAAELGLLPAGRRSGAADRAVAGARLLVGQGGGSRRDCCWRAATCSSCCMRSVLSACSVLSWALRLASSFSLWAYSACRRMRWISTSASSIDWPAKAR